MSKKKKFHQPQEIRSDEGNPKQEQFIDWLCGKNGVKFPFFQNFEEVEMPGGFDLLNNNKQNENNN